MRRRSLVTLVGLLTAAVCLVILAGAPALAQNGTISGTVTDASSGLPLQNVTINVFSGSGGSVGPPIANAPTNASGVYSVSVPGAVSYYLQTSNSLGYRNEAYDNVKCLGCPNNTGTVVSVPPGGLTNGINFGLDRGGTIAGTVTNATTAAVVANAQVQFFTAGSSQSVASVPTNASGVFTSPGLPAGTYYAATTNNNSGLINQWSNGTPYACCSVVTTAPITVTAPNTTTVNFALQPGGAITGTVTNATTAAVVGNVQVQFYTAGSTQSVANVSTNASGVFTSPALATGTYYAATTNNNSGLINQWSNGTPYACCSVVTTAPITVTAPNTTTVNFALQPGARISGTVTNATTTAVVGNVQVQFYTAGSSQSVANVSTNASGVYTSPALPTGTYYAATTNNNSGLINQWSNGTPYACCSVVTTAPITVTAPNTTTVNFALQPGGAIAGTVTNATTAAVVGNVQVQFYTAGSTQPVANVSTNASGVFTSPALATGTYYAATTNNNSGLINQWSNGTPYACCSVVTTAPITVTAPNTTTVNFALQPGARISGTVTNATTSATVANVQVAFYTNAGTQVGNVQSNNSGVYTSSGLPTGTYFVATTSNGAGLVNQWSGGTPYFCCSVVTTAPVVATAPATTTVNFALPPGGTVTGTVTDASSGNPLANVSVRVYYNTGSGSNMPQAGQVQTNASGVYTVGGLPAGSYYAQTLNGQGYVNEAYDNLVCLQCNNNTGAPIPVTQGTATGGINFALDKGGSVSGTVTDASTSAVLSNVQINVYSASSTFGPPAGSAQTNASGVYTVSGLPTGSYYAQTSNSIGYVNEAYDNFGCLQCSPTTGTPITVAAGATTAGVAFTLDKGGTITGTVRNAGTSAALPFVQVAFYTSNGTQVGNVPSDNSGVYTSPGLPAGAYFAATTNNNFGLVNQWSDGAPYLCCPAVPTGPLAVTLSTATTANFALPAGGQITGTVRDAASNAALANVTVRVYGGSGTNPPQIGQAQTNSSGVYTVGGLPTGSYYAQTSNNLGYVNKAYDNIVCLFCNGATGQTIAVTQSTTTSGINFALDGGGSVVGKVTDTATGNPLANVQVSVFASGSGTFPQQVGSAQTAPDGTYAITGLPGGTYYARTTNSIGYVNKAYNDVLCVFCGGTTGNPISVSVGAATGSINFALNRGGSISGTVTSSAGAPLANVSVNVYTGDGAIATNVGSVQTNGSGVYTFSGLPTGTYYAQTFNNLGYVNEAYDNVTCLSCNGKTGKAIAVAVGSTTSGINFALDAGGAISGTVTNAATGLPLSNVQVNVNAPTGGGGPTPPAGSATTTASGTYTVAGLPTGSYYVQTRNSLAFVNKAYDNVVCLNCSSTTGKAVDVTVGATTSGINFVLEQGGSVSGTITDATSGAPLANVTVNAFSSTAGTYSPSVSNAFTNAAGAYTVGGLPTGKYNLQTTNSLGYANEAYNNVACVSCPSTTGTSIDVVVGTTVTGINFGLNAGGAISGTVTDAATGSPVANVQVSIYSVSGTLPPSMLGSAQTNASGVYTFGGLQTGTYYAQTGNSLGYLNKAYDGVLCLSCSGSTGTGIPVTLGQTTGNINFALEQGLTLSGTVTNASTGAAVSGVSVNLYSSTGIWVGRGNTGSSGFYTSSAVPPGLYFASTSNSSGLINELFDDVACVSCSASNLVVTGKSLTLANGTTTTANFALAPGGVIAGTVIDAATSKALFNVQVQIYDTAGTQLSSVWTNSEGRYWTANGLLTGTYFVRTSSPGNYIDQVYKGAACAPCTVLAAGTPVAVTAGTTTDSIDFALNAGGSVAGTVKDASGAPIAFAFVQVYNSVGTSVRSAQTDSLGAYSASGLDTGTYFVRTSNSLGYVDKVFDNAAWSSNALTGTPVPVTIGATANNVNFQLNLGGRVAGTITDVATGLPLSGVSVSVADGSGNSSGAMSDATGAYTVFGLGAGTYYARTSNTLGYIDQIFKELVCQTCSTTSGTPIAVTVGNASTANFALSRGGQVSGVVTSAATGKGVSGATVSVFSSTGAFLTSGRTDDAGRYTTTGGLDTGKYFVKTSNQLGFIDQLYSGYPCAFCPPTSGTPVSVTAGSSTGSINFSLTLGGQLSGRITDTEGTPLQNVTVNVFDKMTGSQAASGMTNSLGSYAVLGLPAGTYVAQTSNAIGYLDRVFDNLPSAGWGNSVTSVGTAITVAVATTTPNINFQLARGGTIAGTIIDATSLVRVPNVGVEVYDAANRYISRSFSNPNGIYRSGGLTPGTYFVRTSSNPQGYVNQLYQGQTCMSCTPSTGTPVTVTGTASTNGIDFSLKKGGAVSGKVTDAASGAGLQGVQVALYDGNNSWVATNMTGANGLYTVPGLASGTYYAKTQASNGYINQLYAALTCVFCGVSGGTPISVTIGATTTEVNFALNLGGGISGTVTNTQGEPLGNVQVNVSGANGQFVQGVLTNPQGRYQTTAGLAAGSYLLRTSNTLGYVDQLFDGRTCVSCSPLGGTPVSVSAGSTTTGINFSLSLGGEITGTVTAAGGSGSDVQPLNYVNVQIFTRAGTFVTSARTNPSGVYRAVGLPDGAYVARTYNDLGFIDQLYNGVACVSCNIGLGTPISVSAGQSTSGINFALPVGGSVAGLVKDGASGAPLPGVRIDFYNSAGAGVGSAWTDPSGRYLTPRGLPTGTYYAQTSNSIGYINVVYKGLDYFRTIVNLGTPIPVTAGSTTIGIDMDLFAGARVSGTVTDAVTKLPVANAQVRIYGADGAMVDLSYTGSSGKYVSSSGLPAGQYYAKAGWTQGYLASLYRDIACPYCSPLTGTAIDLPAVGTVGGIDFSLAVGGTISGIVTDPNGMPLSGVRVSVYNESNTQVSQGTTDSAGHYQTTTGLATGSYYAKTGNSLGYVDMLFSDMVCLACKATTGMPISVTVGQVTPGIDFRLGNGGRISGNVRDQDTGQPLAGIGVSVFDSTNTLVTSGGTDSAGNYLTVGGLPAGAYYLRTSNSQGYVDGLYQALPCVRCNPTRGMPVTVAAGTTTPGIDFALAVGGQVSGTVTAAEGGGGLGSVKVSLYNASGGLVGSVYTNAAGSFTSPPVPAGKYFARTLNVQGYVDELFSNIACAPCTILNGGEIDVVKGAMVSGIDFALDTGGLVTGFVTDSGTGAPIVGVTVSFYSAGGTYVATSGATNDQGYYAISLPVGSYSARVDAVDGYAVTITSKPWTSADGLITVTKGEETSGVAFPLQACKPPTLDPAVLPTVLEGAPYEGSLTASGATAPYTFSLTEGTLTPGLALNGTSGRLAGTPTTLGNASFTLAAADATGCATTRSYTQFTCGITLGSSEAVSSYTGGQGTLDINTNAADCPWTASTDVSWITITGGSGAGSGRLTFAVAPSTQWQSPRRGTITVGGQTLILTQGAAETSPPIGVFDTPADGATGLQGSFAVTGWALDDTGIDRVEIWRDLVAGEDPAHAYTTDPTHPAFGKVFIAKPLFITGSRPDVEALYDNYPQAGRAGWGFLLLSWGLYQQGNGTYTLYAYAYDLDGHSALIGTKTIAVDNAHATKPFGAIDTPSYEATVSGGFWNYGWALTPGAVCTVTNGNVMMNIDSGPFVTVNYGDLRADIAASFPGFTNANNAGGAYFIDTTQYANGMHQIGWVVTDSCGRQDGIGSRFFNVLNTSAERGGARPSAGSGSEADRATPDSATAAGRPQEPNRNPIGLRQQGEDWQWVWPNEDGWRVVEVGQTGRIEVQLPQSSSGYYTGYQVGNGEQRPLPLGSSVDSTSGIFYWQPAPGFLGVFNLVFEGPGSGAVRVQVVVR